MAAGTSIEWTEVTWNPTTGCDRISAGCDNCYALTLAKRLKAMGQLKYQNDGDPRTSGPGFGLTIHASALRQPYTWGGHRVVFVNSMSDLFHARVPLDFVRQVFAVIADTPQHTYQVLTKRSARLPKIAAKLDWPANLWMGVSIEHSDMLFRADHLRTVPAAIRFVSLEPLLGPLPGLDLTGIDWVIAGGESGPGHRPVDPGWIRDLRDQSVGQGVAFFFKLLCTNSRNRQPAAQQFLIAANDRAQNGRWTYSAAGKRIPKSRSMVCRKRELDKVALFRGSVVRPDGDVEQELPASSTADRKHPGDEPRLAINGRARPGLMDGQNLVVHARKPSNRAGKAAA
jgi:protein gp37